MLVTSKEIERYYIPGTGRSNLFGHWTITRSAEAEEEGRSTKEGGGSSSCACPNYSSASALRCSTDLFVQALEHVHRRQFLSSNCCCYSCRPAYWPPWHCPLALAWRYVLRRRLMKIDLHPLHPLQRLRSSPSSLQLLSRQQPPLIPPTERWKRSNMYVYILFCVLPLISIPLRLDVPSIGRGKCASCPAGGGT